MRHFLTAWKNFEYFKHTVWKTNQNNSNLATIFPYATGIIQKYYETSDHMVRKSGENTENTLVILCVKYTSVKNK